MCDWSCHKCNVCQGSMEHTVFGACLARHPEIQVLIPIFSKFADLPCTPWPFSQPTFSFLINSIILLCRNLILKIILFRNTLNMAIGFPTSHIQTFHNTTRFTLFSGFVCWHSRGEACWPSLCFDITTSLLPLFPCREAITGQDSYWAIVWDKVQMTCLSSDLF